MSNVHDPHDLLTAINKSPDYITGEDSNMPTSNTEGNTSVVEYDVRTEYAVLESEIQPIIRCDCPMCTEVVVTHATTPAPEEPADENAGPSSECYGCAATFPDDEMYLTASDCGMVCDECAVCCGNCGNRDARSNMHRVYHRRSMQLWCEACYSDDSTRCERCDMVLSCGSAYYDDDDCCNYCADCHDQVQSERRSNEYDSDCCDDDDDEDLIISSYHSQTRRRLTRPIESPWSKAHAGRLLGVELEIEVKGGLDRVDVARTVLSAANTGRAPQHMFCEHDGSLNYGFEMISQPMGLDLHRELWTRVLATPELRSCRSHNTETCGLHVHVSRAGLAELTIAKAVVVMNSDAFEALIRTVARRYSNGFCVKKNNIPKPRRLYITSQGRYEFLNTEGGRTIEFRVFRGTLRLESVLAAAEFAHAILEWCKETSVTALTPDSFLTWLQLPENSADTRALRGLLARRNAERYGHLVNFRNTPDTTTPSLEA